MISDKTQSEVRCRLCNEEGRFKVFLGSNSVTDGLQVLTKDIKGIRRLADTLQRKICRQNVDTRHPLANLT